MPLVGQGPSEGTAYTARTNHRDFYGLLLLVRSRVNLCRELFRGMRIDDEVLARSTPWPIDPNAIINRPPRNRIRGV